MLYFCQGGRGSGLASSAIRQDRFQSENEGGGGSADAQKWEEQRHKYEEVCGFSGEKWAPKINLKIASEKLIITPLQPIHQR